MVKKYTPYKDKLLDPRWQKMRLEVFSLNDFTCQFCGNTEQTLHAHHLYYSKTRNPWDVDISAILCLCSTCHKIEHLEGLTKLEKEIIDTLTTVAIVYSGKNEHINFLVRQINTAILKHRNNG